MKNLLLGLLLLLSIGVKAQDTEATQTATSDIILGTGGFTPTKVNTALRSIIKGKPNYLPYVVSGTNTYSFTATSSITSYTNSWFVIRIVNSNTVTNPTINITPLGGSALGVKNLVKDGLGTALAIGDLKSNTYYHIFYDGTNFQVALGGGSGGGSTYAGNSPTTITVGGIGAGTNIAGSTYDALFQALLAPYVNPTWSFFSVGISPTNVETGVTLSGSKNFSWSITSNSGTITGIDIVDITTSSNLVTNTPNDGSQSVTINTITLNSNGQTQQFRGVLHNSTGSDINSGTFTVIANYPYFYGPSATTPTTSAAVRLLPSKGLLNSLVFNYNTGTTQTKFPLITPPGHSLVSVIDTDALGANITGSFTYLGTINVLDAGGNNLVCSQYEYNASGTYSPAHNLTVTLN